MPEYYAVYSLVQLISQLLVVVFLTAIIYSLLSLAFKCYMDWKHPPPIPPRKRKRRFSDPIQDEHQ